MNLYLLLKYINRLALALHPHVLRKAQEEVDTVVGSKRPPDFGDEDKLPYIRAMFREVMRWRPVAPTAIPHASIKVSSKIWFAEH